MNKKVGRKPKRSLGVANEEHLLKPETHVGAN